MCQNFAQSIITFILSYSISIYLIRRNETYDWWNATFIISFCSIQLWEAIIYLEPKYNEYMTLLILITLYIQPTCQLLWYCFHVRKFSYISFGFMFWLLLFIGRMNNIDSLSSEKGIGGSLIWKDGNKNFFFHENKFSLIIYGICISLPTLYQEKKGDLLFLTGCITLISSVIKGYYYYNTFFHPELGSLWCYSANIYSIITML